jgi:hypothetical protein
MSGNNGSIPMSPPMSGNVITLNGGYADSGIVSYTQGNAYGGVVTTSPGYASGGVVTSPGYASGGVVTTSPPVVTGYQQGGYIDAGQIANRSVTSPVQQFVGQQRVVTEEVVSGYQPIVQEVVTQPMMQQVVTEVAQPREVVTQPVVTQPREVITQTREVTLPPPPAEIIERIVEVEVIKEVPVDRVVEVPVDRIVDRYVEVPVEKIVERSREVSPLYSLLLATICSAAPSFHGVHHDMCHVIGVRPPHGSPSVRADASCLQISLQLEIQQIVLACGIRVIFATRHISRQGGTL